ncbi:hypothetical protein B224_0484 [Aeromonas media WS]|nr:hypothetical protein B224_0484 [Aeromonas media WS]
MADLFTQSGRIVHNQHQQFTFEWVKETGIAWAREECETGAEPPLPFMRPVIS